MNKLIIITTLSILFFAASQICGCGSCKAQAEEKVQTVQAPKVLRLKLSGITCAACANHVSKALKSVEGVME